MRSIYVGDTPCSHAMCNSFAMSIFTLIAFGIGVTGWLGGTRPFLESNGDKSEVNYPVSLFLFTIDLVKLPLLGRKLGKSLPIGYWAHSVVYPYLIGLAVYSVTFCSPSEGDREAFRCCESIENVVGVSTLRHNQSLQQTLDPVATLAAAKPAPASIAAEPRRYEAAR